MAGGHESACERAEGAAVVAVGGAPGYDDRLWSAVRRGRAGGADAIISSGSGRPGRSHATSTRGGRCRPDASARGRAGS